MNKIRTICLIFAWLLIAGCATTPKPGDTTTANLPIGVRCEAKAVPVPAFAVDLLPLAASPAQLFDALVIEREQRKAFIVELQAAVRACQ